MSEVIRTVDLTVAEGAPVHPDVLIERDAEDRLVILAEGSHGMLQVSAWGRR